MLQHAATIQLLGLLYAQKDKTEQFESYKKKMLPNRDAKDELAAMYLQTDHIDTSPSYKLMHLWCWCRWSGHVVSAKTYTCKVCMFRSYHGRGNEADVQGVTGDVSGNICLPKQDRVITLARMCITSSRAGPT